MCFVEIYLVFQKLILTFEGVIALQEIMWKFFLILLLYNLPTLTAWAQTDTTKSTLFQFGTSDMLALPPDVTDVQVTTSSKNAENLQDALASITVVSAYEIEGYGALSLRDVLDRVVGTYITGSYYMPNNIISIRGDVTNGFNTHVLILLDGRPMRENLFNGFNSAIYSGISLSSIERIEIVRGPGSVLYGTAAFAGVVNIILKKGKKNATHGNQTVGSFNTLISEVGTGFDKGKFKLATNFRLMNSAGWDFRVYDHERAWIDEKASDRSASATLQASYGGLQLSSFVGVNRCNNFAEGEFIKNTPYRQIENTRLFTDLAYQKELTKWWTIAFNVTYNRSRFYEDIPLLTSNVRGNYHDAFSTDLLIEGYSYFKPIKHLNITVGGLRNILSGQFAQPHLTPDGNLYDYGLGAINSNPRISTPRYNNTWYSGYFQADYTFKEKLKILIGAQYNQANNKQSFVPRAGLLYKISPALAGKVMYGEAFRNGSSYERLSTEDESFGNPNLNPELIRTLEVNFSYTHPKKKAVISLTGYKSWSTNVIALSSPDDSLYIYPVTGESIPLYVNIAAFRYHGIEFEGKYTLTKHLQINHAISWQEAEQDLQNNKTLKQATGIPRLMFKTGVLYKNSEKGVQAGVFYSYFSKVTPINEYDIDGHAHEEETKEYNPAPDAYHFVSLNVGFDIRTLFDINNIPSTTLSIFVQNALNQNIYYADYNRSEVNSVAGRGGRGIYGRVAVKF